jgi:uncharacterized protein (DUF2141 family)
MTARKTVLFAIALLASAQAVGADLTVTVTDLRSTSGSVGLSLVDTAAGWDGQAKPIKRQKQPIQGSNVVFTLQDLPAGEYALSVIHDENDNGKLDTNFIGMPTEGYGFSNNPKVMRKATFEEARFELAADGAAITVRLR